MVRGSISTVYCCLLFKSIYSIITLSNSLSEITLLIFEAFKYFVNSDHELIFSLLILIILELGFNKLNEGPSVSTL